MTPKPSPLVAADLEPDDATRLAALLADAVTRQSRALDDAINGGMRHLPRLLRGPVKAVLFR
jgi:hypothetical protein